MKAIVLAALLALASCTANSPAYAGGKDTVDVSKIDVHLPVDISSLTAAEKKLFMEDFCKDPGCVILPESVVSQVKEEEEKMLAYIQRQAREIATLKANIEADEKLNAELKDRLKAST